MSTEVAAVKPTSILANYAESMGLSGAAMYAALAETIFPSKDAATPEQVNALLIVANQHSLNPFTREIYAFPAKGKGVVPVVSIDGWLKLANNHPQFDGLQTQYVYGDGGDLLGCEATIWRKDRGHPCVVEEDLQENKRNTEPWRNQPKRMLRHRAIIQCIRMAFSFSGIYEPDEGARFADAKAVPLELREEPATTPVASSVAAMLEGKAEPEAQAEEPEDEPWAKSEPPTEAEMQAADGTLYGDADKMEDPA